MKRLDGHDELLSRLAAADPAAHLAPMTDGALERIARRATHPSPKSWTWQRFRLASLGAFVGSGALVIGGILGIESAAPGLPGLPVLALGQARTAKAGPSLPGSSGMMIPFESFQFTADSSLSSTPGSATSYELSASVDAATAAAQVAQALGVQGDVTSTGGGSYQVGPDGGPDVTTSTSGGITSFDFEAATTASSSPVGDGVTTPPTDASGALPTDDQATQDAEALLRQLGVTSDLGTPSVSNDGTEVWVTIPIVVDGLTTDQSLDVAYGPSSVVDSVSGEFLNATAATTYPTISQTDAVNVVIAHHGFVYCGGIVPVYSPTTGASPAAASGGPTSTTSPGATPSSSDGSPPTDPTTTPTDPSTTIPEPVIDVDVNQATMGLSTYALTDGTSVLLPTWNLSGPETGSTVTSGSTYTANVMAVDSQYVQLQTCPMFY